MSSLPSEVLADVLQPLDRWTLDAVEFTNRRFLQVVMEHMSDVCLRLIDEAFFTVTYKEDALWRIRIDSRREREGQNEDVIRLFSEFLQSLRSSHVADLALVFFGSEEFVFTPAMATLVLETPIIAHQLRLVRGSYAELTPAQFRELVLHFSPTSVHIALCDLRPPQVSDEFIRVLFKNGVLKMRMESGRPEVGEHDAFHVTDDAIVDFLAQEDGQHEQEGEPGGASLVPFMSQLAHYRSILNRRSLIH